MSSAALGGAPFLHRARLFPLPILAAVARPPSLSSARTRYRFKLQRTIAAVTNRAVCSLNRLYSSPSFPSSSSPLSQPDHPFCSCCPSLEFSSAAQHRTLALLRAQCASFVKKARLWSHTTPPSGDIDASVLDLLRSLPSYSSPPSSIPSASSDASAGEQRSPLANDQQLLQQLSDSVFSLPIQPLSSAFSTAPTAVVPLIASRVALPERLNIVPMLDVLSPAVAASYRQPAAAALMRAPVEVLHKNLVEPLKAPRVAGSRSEYVMLLRRMLKQGMISFTAHPKAVNGVFAVAKDAESDRLIIDAQPCNRLFIDSPHVALPGPSHLVQLRVPKGRRMYVCKSDLSNFYHHIGVVEWLQPYFALPPLTPAELRAVGAPLGAAFPMCVTLPMGFSHAVYLAQSIHLHVAYSAGAIDPRDSILSLVSPDVTADRTLHGIIVDDYFGFSLDKVRLRLTIERMLTAYRAAGFVVKDSKVVFPTSEPVKVIGFDVDGSQSTVALPAASQLSLIGATVRLLRADIVTGAQLSHVVGRWTWVMMLRRSSLAVLQQVYPYCRKAQGRPFTLWPSVRRELCMLLSLLPLLHARLDAPFFSRALASDASELAGGVVVTSLEPSLHASLWPLCSSRHHAVQQAKLNAQRKRAARPHAAQRGGLPHPDIMAADVRAFDSFYDVVGQTPWRTIVSKPWLGSEHINALELRAALLAVHWALSHPSALNSRVYLLLDSTVAFFTLWKGRSSSPQLLLIMRKISALLLAGGIALLPGWVPSEVNPADAPSRLLDDCPTSGRARR